MQRINFFHQQYKKEVERNDEEFAIIDDGKLAHTIDASEEKWDIKIENKNRKNCLFTPIDHNIVIKERGNETPQCDGMLTTSDKNNLVFIEIKSQQKGADSEAEKQLRSTINFFSKCHNIAQWNNRRAYIVNRLHPVFHYSNKERCQNFNSQTGFILRKQDICSIK